MPAFPQEPFQLTKGSPRSGQEGIAGARHIDLERLAGRAGEVDRERPVVFQCRLGARSAMATQAFRAAGWDAYNLTGGITEWVRRGLPIEPEGGYVAEH